MLQVERHGARLSVHERLMSAVLRAARVQDDSHTAIETHAAVVRMVEETVEDGRTAREKRRAFAIRQARVQNRSPSG